MRGNRERQAHVHTAAVTLDRRIQELLDLGKSDNFIELPLDLRSRHAQNRPVQKNIFSAGEFGMKAGPDFQQTRYAATNADTALCWFRDPAENFQEGGLATAVAPNNAHNIALVNFKIDVAQRPDLFMAVTLYNGVAVHQIFGLMPHAADVVHEHIPKSHITAVFGLVADHVFLSEAFRFDNGIAHLCKTRKDSSCAMTQRQLLSCDEVVVCHELERRV